VSCIQVRSFRGIGDDSQLRLTPGPGVTLVVGRNGSGKSSFAEGAEVAFTGTSARWAAKGSTEWQKGWRNVHSALAPRLVVELVQEGNGAKARVERTWSDPDDFKSGLSQVVGSDKSRQRLADTGWGAALEHYRPFLSYSELGGMLAGGPTKIYEALLAGLGLDDFVRVRDWLASAEGEQGKLWDAARKAATVLGEKAQGLAAAHPDEARFASLAGLLGKTKRDVDAVAALVTGRAGDERGQVIEALAAIAAPITPDIVERLPRDLRDAAAQVQAVRGRTEGLMLGLSRLLTEALAYAKTAPQDGCPVCGSDRSLDAAWQAATTTRLREIETTAANARKLEEDVRELVRLTRAACTPAPPVVALAATDGVTAAARAAECWNDWARGATLADAESLAAHVELRGPALLAALDRLRRHAQDEAARRDVVWQPFAEEVADWVAQMRAATRAKAIEKDLEDAKKWVAAEIEAERERRFAPVKARAIEFWNTIARESNVQLQDIDLTGHGNAKRVALKVTVDDKEAPALGVLSQGELNAMTLSLFLPRVLMPATPFGFVIVDDPVQAMDEVRVDGLAQVLTEVGRTRQVVVFTHDARLPEAFERLSLPHGKRRVTRGLGSAVVVSPLVGPWEQRLKDALDVTLTPDLPEHISGRVVPGFCRQALEAACVDTLRRHWLGRGDAHADVEKQLARRGLRELLAMLFFGDPHKHQGLTTRLRKLKVKDAVEIVTDCQNGAHAGFSGNLKEMVERTRSLCDELGKVTPP
jgi:recombinational DNA repair ATPase RecF